MVGDFPLCGGFGQLLVRLDILADQPQWPRVEICLWRVAEPPALRQNIAVIGKKRRLSAGLECWKHSAFLAATGDCHSQPKAFQRIARRLAKRSSKETRRHIFAIVDVSINTAAVSSSVENSGGIVYVCDVTPYLHALITVRNKVGGKRPFHKQQIISGL